MKNKLIRRFAVTLAAVLCMAAFSVTAYAGGVDPDPEPLPENDPLWDTKHLILTPHISGNLTLGYTCDRNVELFCEDLANYAAGRPLSHLVDRKRGY